MLNAMNLIWAFQFKQVTDPTTGLPVPVDVFDYHKVRSYRYTTHYESNNKQSGDIDRTKAVQMFHRSTEQEQS